MTAKSTTNGFNYTHYDVYFPNINLYTSGEKVAKPDTAGKLQIWIYRDDDQNIIPASGGHPPIKKIIQVPGTFPIELQGYGIIILYDYDYTGYSVHPPAVTLSVLKEIFSNSRWTVDKFY